MDEWMMEGRMEQRTERKAHAEVKREKKETFLWEPLVKTLAVLH